MIPIEPRPADKKSRRRNKSRAARVAWLNWVTARISCADSAGGLTSDRNKRDARQADSYAWPEPWRALRVRPVDRSSCGTRWWRARLPLRVPREPALARLRPVPLDRRLAGTRSRDRRTPRPWRPSKQEQKSSRTPFQKEAGVRLRLGPDAAAWRVFSRLKQGLCRRAASRVSRLPRGENSGRGRGWQVVRQTSLSTGAGEFVDSPATGRVAICATCG